MRACVVATGDCAVIADRLSLPKTVEVDRDGTVWVVENDGFLSGRSGSSASLTRGGGGR
jgi:hypothetical protein